MKKSVRPFHPLDILENRRYLLQDGPSPKIKWGYTERVPGDSGVHDWSGYWRVEKDGYYDIHVRADDNGYIRIGGFQSGFSGHNSTKVSQSISVFLKKGYHYVELHHENLTPRRNVANAQEFIAYIGGEEVTKLINISEPRNILARSLAQKFLDEYSIVNYHNIPSTENKRVWGLFGKTYQENAQKAGWENTCALRVSIALNRMGYSLADAPGKNNVMNGGGDVAILNPDNPDVLRRHVVISARNMETYLTSLLGEPDYSDPSKYSTPQEGDIVIFAGKDHAGMAPGNDSSVGFFFSGKLWLLSRLLLDD